MTLNKTLRWISILSIFAITFIPLVVSSYLFFPYITGKNVLFRALAEIGFGAWLILAFRDRRYRLPVSFISISLGVFLFILFIADLHGAYWYKSFWSNFERMEGLVAHIHLFLYFLVASAMIKGEKLWRRLFQTSLGVSIIVGFFAVTQLFASGSFQSTRVDATLGNADYLAVYMLFNAFFALYLILRKETGRVERWIYSAITLFDLIIMYFTATRGVILGFGVGLFIMMVLISIFEKENLNLRKWSRWIIAVLIAIVIIFVLVRNVPAVKNNSVLGRFATASLTGGDISARFQIWDMAFQGFKERPILGWGQDNFNFVFNKYYNPGMYGQEQWFDRSHDVFLDWLIAGGILGLLSYLLIFAGGVYYIWRKEHHAFWKTALPFLRKSQNQLSIVEKSLFTGLLAGYFFQNLFVFDNIVSYILFFSVLAFIASMSKPITEIEYAEPKSVLANSAAVLIIVLVCVGIYEFAWKPFIASHDLVYAIEIQPTGDASTNMTYFQRCT